MKTGLGMHAMIPRLLAAPVIAMLLVAPASWAQRKEQLRYRVRAGLRFTMHITARGTIITQVLGQPASKKDLYYELDVLQSIEEAGSKDFAVRMQPVIKGARLLLNGQAQPLDREKLPESLTQMTRLGEVVRFEYLGGTRPAAKEPQLIPVAGLGSALPKLPEHVVAAGARWPAMPAPGGPGFRSEVVLSGFEALEARECARLQIHSSNAAAADRRLVESMARQGLSLEARTQADYDVYFALETGWPVAGTGRTQYETVLRRDKRTLNLTRYDFRTRFQTRLP